MYTVQDGVRALQFEGEEIAASSSRGRNKYRWVEFKLYRTSSGRYVVSRIGVSLYFHHSGCSVVKRNGISPVPAETLSLNLVPCEDCRPLRGVDEDLYPETSRHWAQILESAEAVVSSLKKYDENGTEYLTDVARRLLVTAAKNDEDIHAAFYVEWID